MSRSRGSALSENLPSGDPHGWNSLDHYLQIHYANMDGLREYFVENDDELRMWWVDQNHIHMEGRIYCRYGMYVDIRKTIEVNDDRQARTVRYKYQACLEGPTSVEIVRYDNAHPHEGHPDEHHKHVNDPVTGKPVAGSPFWVGRRGWPTLRQFMDEIHDWYHETGGEKPVQIPPPIPPNL